MYEVRDIGNNQVEVYDRDSGRTVFRVIIPLGSAASDARINGNELRVGPVNNQYDIYDVETGRMIRRDMA